MRSSRRQERKGGGVRARGWGEAHRARFTPALLLCSLLDLYLWNVRGTFSWMFYVPIMLNALSSIYLVQRKNVPLPRTLLWYKLARFYGLSAPFRIFRLRESSCGQWTITLRAILPNLLPAILTLYYTQQYKKSVLE